MMHGSLNKQWRMIFMSLKCEIVIIYMELCEVLIVQKDPKNWHLPAKRLGNRAEMSRTESEIKGALFLMPWKQEAGPGGVTQLFLRMTRVGSLHLYGSSQAPVTLIPRELTLFLSSLGTSCT